MCSPAHPLASLNRHNGPMQEVFSRTDDSGIPLGDQEFYELRLSDSDDIWRPGYIVMQSRATWSELDGQMMRDEIEIERLPTLERAEGRYAARRLVLTERGFGISDMDF